MSTASSTPLFCASFAGVMLKHQGSALISLIIRKAQPILSMIIRAYEADGLLQLLKPRAKDLACVLYSLLKRNGEIRVPAEQVIPKDTSLEVVREGEEIVVRIV